MAYNIQYWTTTPPVALAWRRQGSSQADHPGANTTLTARRNARRRIRLDYSRDEPRHRDRAADRRPCLCCLARPAALQPAALYPSARHLLHFCANCAAGGSRPALRHRMRGEGPRTRAWTAARRLGPDRRRGAELDTSSFVADPGAPTQAERFT